MLARWTGLVCDQSASEHALGFFCGFFNRARKTYAASFASVSFFELAFAAAARVDLGFDDPEGPVHFACGCFGVFGFEDNAAI